MKTQIWISLKLFIVLTILTGIIYPLLVTVSGNLFFGKEEEGSLIYYKEKLIGSELIAQKFTSDRYFHSRPSAVDYSTVASGASNLGPISTNLIDLIKERRKSFIEFNRLSPNEIVPEDMLFASGSGLDPHISKRAAILQINRIVIVRKFDDNQKIKLNDLVEKTVEEPQFGFLGEERVNVLKLNIALDKLQNDTVTAMGNSIFNNN